MNKNLKIIISVVFVLSVTFFVARAFWPQPTPKKPATHAVAKKKKPVSIVKKKSVAAQTGARMAIILDDWGPSVAHVDEAVAIGKPLTLAVIPNLRRSRAVAEAAHAQGLGVMLHMPMEPENRKPSEPHAILTAMGDAQIRSLLDEALASVPHVEGVNNHQGSAATSDLRVMTTALSYLKKKGLFFVDSKVIASSVAAEAAKKTGIRFASRDVFIDNVATVAAVKAQLRAAIEVARTHGEAVVIGHDKLPTIEAIRQMVPEIEKSGVKLVLIKELL